MDWASITHLPNVGWATAVAMAIALAAMILGVRYENKKKIAKELQDAEQAVRDAVIDARLTHNMDAYLLAVQRLRNARKAASLPTDDLPFP